MRPEARTAQPGPQGAPPSAGPRPGWVGALRRIAPAADAERIAGYFVATCTAGQHLRDDTCVLALRRLG